MNLPPRTDDSMAAASNGDLQYWQEREADRARGNYPDDCRGTASADSISNVEMSDRCAKLDEQHRIEIEENGCCGRRWQDGWCPYLNKMCPDVALAKSILHDTRGLK